LAQNDQRIIHTAELLKMQQHAGFKRWHAAQMAAQLLDSSKTYCTVLCCAGARI
jgi:hypothetical protein